MPRPAKNVLFSKEEFGQRLRALREARGMTQIQLAGILGIDQSNLSAIERGIRGLTVHQAVKFAKALRVSTDEILTGAVVPQGRKPLRSLKLLRRLQRIEELPESKQRAVIKILDAVLDQQSSAHARH